MTVSIALEAERDLEQIAGFIALENPARAISFVRELVVNCHALAAHPFRYAALADDDRQLRRFPWRGYSIYYRVIENEAVVIVHILNDALDHDPILRD